MKKRVLYRICSLLMLATLLTLTVSCRQGGEEQQTETVTTTATEVSSVDESTAAAVTEPPQPEGPTVQEICEAYNRQVKIMFAEEDDGHVDAEAMLDAMLPYLMGSGESFSAADNYLMNNITVTGDAMAMPDEILCRDGIKITQGTDPEYGVYREIEVSHKNGVAYLSTYDDVTTVDGVSLDPESSLLGDLDGATMTILAKYLTEETEEGIWEVSDIHSRQILRALLGEETVSALKNNDMSCTLDASAFDGTGTLVMNMVLSSPVELRLALRLDGIGESRESMEMTITAGEESEIYLACGLTDGIMDKMQMRVRTGEDLTEVVQTVSGTHTDLTMLVKAGDTVNLSCKFALDMLNESEGKGTVEVIFRTGEEEMGQILPLSSTSVESVALGEFAVRLDGDEIALMEMTITTRADTVLSETKMMVVQSGAVVGESVMYYAMSMKDSADPTLDTSFEMEAKLISQEGNVSQYALGLSVRNGTETPAVNATVTTPTSKKLKYSLQEERLIGRAKSFLGNYEACLAEAQQSVDALMQILPKGNIAALPSTFYISDRNSDGIVVLIHLVEDNGYYVYADMLLDVENYDYFYAGYTTDLYKVTPSGLESEASLRSYRLRERDGYHVVGDGGNAVYYWYNSAEQVYVLWDMESNKHGYMTEEPTAEHFPGRTIHPALFRANDELAAEVHDFAVTYDSLCYEILTCRACELTLKSHEPIHHIEAETVVCEAKGTRPRTVVGSCQHCDNVKQLILTDTNGSELHFTLKRLDADRLTGAVAPYTKYLLEYIDPSRDLSNHYVISGATMTGTSFVSDVIIPDLRRVTGETILGFGIVDLNDQYSLPSGLDLRLILPEGMEFLIGSKLEKGLFHTVSELQLPETMVYVDSLFRQSPIKELVIPASVRYLDADMSFPNLQRLTIKANFDVLPEIEAPKLESLSLLGKYRVIKGLTGGAPIEELYLPEGVEEIGMRGFAYLKNLKRLTLPDSLTVIPDHAFRGCSSLESLRIPDTVTAIGQSAFAECSALTEVVLSSRLEHLRFGVFESAKSLKQITLPKSVKILDSAVFRNCVSLEKVEVLGELTSVGYDAFYNCPLLTEIPGSEAH